MIIHDMHIHAFGCYHDFSLSFSAGLTILLGDNESGKSTLMAFIRAMFYGFDGKHQSLEKDRRREYKAWYQDVMGGVIRFSQAGLVYRLERRFSRLRADDSTALYREQTGETVYLKEQDRPGQTLLGLSEAEFINTLFAGQREIAVDAVSDRTARLFDDTDGVYGSDRVKQHLTNAKNRLIGRRGRMAELDREYDRLSEIYVKAEAAASEKAAVAVDISELDQRLHAIEVQLEQERRRRETASAIDILERNEQVKALDDEAIQDDASPHRIEITAAGENITIRALSDLSDANQRLLQIDTSLEKLAEQAHDKENELDRLAGDYDALADAGIEADRMVAVLSQKEISTPPAFSNKKQRGFSVLLAAGAIMFFLALLLGQSHPPFTYVLLAGVASMLGGGIGLFWDVKRREDAVKSRRSEHRQLRFDQVEAEKKRRQIASLQQNVAGYYQHAKRSYDVLQRQLNGKVQKRNQAGAALRDALHPYCGRVDDSDIGFAITRLRQQMITPADMAREQRYRALLKNESPEGFRQQVDAAKTLMRSEGIDPADYRQAGKRLDQTFGTALTEKTIIMLESERDDLFRLRQEKMTALSWIGRELDSQEEVARHLAAVEEERRLVKHLAESIELASTWLEAAIGDIDTRLAPRINELASRYLAAITDDEYKTVFIDRHLAVHDESRDGTLGEQASSSGATVDQIELALRLALSTLISIDTDCMPLFLDETLAQLDADGMRRTLNALTDETNTGKRQLVYMTSDKRVMKAVDDGVNVLVLN